MNYYKIKNKLPGSGFILFITVCILSSLFIFWIMQEMWYERLGTERETERDKISKTEYDLKINKERNRKALEFRLGKIEEYLKVKPDNYDLKGRKTKLLYLLGRKEESYKVAADLLERNRMSPGSIFVLTDHLNSNFSHEKSSALAEKFLKSYIPGKSVFRKEKYALFGDNETIFSCSGIILFKSDRERLIKNKFILKKESLFPLLVEKGSMNKREIIIRFKKLRVFRSKFEVIVNNKRSEISESPGANDFYIIIKPANITSFYIIQVKGAEVQFLSLKEKGEVLK